MANINTSVFSKTYNVATGTDMFVTFDDFAIGTIQGISYSITRQKAPIYVMGRPDPVSVARSKRGIAGSMIMTTYDRHCLADFMTMSTFAAKSNAIETTSVNPFRDASINNDGITEFPSALSGSDIKTSLESNNALNVFKTQIKTGAISRDTQPMYPDQLLPFDITIVSANEYGTGSVMRIFGVEILNEGSGTSVDDTSNEVQMTYIARLVIPWVTTARTTDYSNV